MAPWHTIRAGEDLHTIAHDYGLADWKVIYDHAENTAFKERYPNPDILEDGDRVFVPNRELKKQQCETEKRHTFEYKRPTTFLRVVLKDENGNAYAGKKYRLVVGWKTFEGTTDDQGLVAHQVPADTTRGRLTLWLGDDPAGEVYTWHLQIGHLEPIGTICGVQARLNNLGFDCGPEDGAMSPRLQGALKRFQHEAGLDETGELDDTTREKLEEMHDKL
jgi:N-acetylmuramoyl-L-alanine amidase